MTPSSKFVVLTTVLLIIGFAFALPALGQRRPGAILERERDLQNRSRGMQKSENEASSPVKRRDPRLAFAQIKEDFKRIQVVNNTLMLAASKAEPLDLKFVGQSASEIKKLAGQLKSNLTLPEPEKVTKHPQGERLRPMLETLDRLIIEFVNNPILKEANLIDAQLSGKARRSLDEIIELSGQVKKSSEKLGKTVQKSQ